MVGTAHLQRERNGALLRVHADSVLEKLLDTADIVREAMLSPIDGDCGKRSLTLHFWPMSQRHFWASPSGSTKVGW